MQHNVRIVSSPEDETHTRYFATCSCGWESVNYWYSEFSADVEGDAHVAQS